MNLPTEAISVKQPWAWLIVHGRKDIENRDWRMTYRGPILIHAAKVDDSDAFSCFARDIHPVNYGKADGVWPKDEEISYTMWRRGGIIGVVDVVDVVDHSVSPWFVGRYGFVLANARPLPFMPCRGQPGRFKASYREPAHPQ